MFATTQRTPTSYIDPINLREVLESYFNGTLDCVPSELNKVIHLPLSEWFDNSLLGQLTSDDITHALSQLALEEAAVIKHFLTAEDSAIPPELQHHYLSMCDRYPDPLDYLTQQFEIAFEKLAATIHAVL